MTERVPYVRLTWRGGTHVFRLVDGLHDAEHAVLRRLVGGGWSVEDVTRTISAALAGGGTVAWLDKPDPFDRLDGGKDRKDKAHAAAVEALVKTHIEARPLAESLPLAQLALIARITGIPADLADQGLDVEAIFAAMGEHADG